jgi:heat shock protein HslJ
VNYKIITFALLLALFLVACGGEQASPTPPATEPPTAEPTTAPAASPTAAPTAPPPLAPPEASLQDVEWLVQSYRDADGSVKETLAGSQVYAFFKSDGNLEGSAGCNRYSATYQIDGDKFQISPIASTMMACPEPPGLMAQETAYLAALQGTAAYRLGENSLELLDAGGLVVVTYRMPDASSVQSPALDVPIPASLSAESLGNATYLNEFVTAGTVTLVNGTYREPAAPGSAGETVVNLGEWIAYGQLADGRPVAAVILTTSTGGSGTFYQLYLMHDASGQPVALASTFLGDRVKINSLAFEGDQIVVDLVVQGPKDAMCCPTQAVVDTYAFKDGQLVKVSSVPGSGPGLTGVTWQWVEFQSMDGTVVKPADPTQYTLEFKTDGTLSIQADCNSGGGVYTTSSSQLDITIQVVTLEQCSPESLSQKYVQYLDQIVSYVMQDGHLFLALPIDSGILEFAPTQ